jgi:ligand-binding sensor domain-containing protein/DNA-binding CsgD family transcriptional regulator
LRKANPLLRPILFFFFLFVLQIALAQELPPVNYYSPEVYGAGNQNWMLSQADDGSIYVANNAGLLTYNGAQWYLYPNKNESIMRSVKWHNDKIYSGCYMDMGYWQYDASNVLTYTSLFGDSDVEPIEDEQIWNIYVQQQQIIFQSLDAIYSYDTISEQLRRIAFTPTIRELFAIDGQFLFQTADGLFEIRNNQVQLISDDSFYQQNAIITFYQHKEETRFVTQSGSVYSYENGIPNFLHDIQSEEPLNVYSAINDNNGLLVVGTVDTGVYVVDENGMVEQNLAQTDGLGNNTVLSLLQDEQGKLWAGLDNGISVIDSNTGIYQYKDKDGTLGTVYCSVQEGEQLYLGTNQGLFYRPDSSMPYQFVEGTSGQVWSLKKFDDAIFCGHNRGTFLVRDGTARLISTVEGAWDIQSIQGRPDLLLQGNYSGLYILHNDGTGWSMRNKLEGFDKSSKDFAMQADKIYVSHEYKGVFELELDEGYSKVTKSVKVAELQKGVFSDIINIQGDVIYTSRDGVYLKRKNSDSFNMHKELSSLFEDDQYIAGNMEMEDESSFWLFLNESITRVSHVKFDNSFQWQSISIPSSDRFEKKGYQNVTKLDNGRLLFGNSTGYLIVEPTQNNQLEFDVRINRVSTSGNTDSLIEFKNQTSLNIPFVDNDLSIYFNTPAYSLYYQPQYRYKVIGLEDDYSEWQTEASVFFENLDHGSYTFIVESRVGQKISKTTASMDFTIERPWYLSTWAIIAYILLLVIFIIAVNLFYRSYYKKQKNAALLKKERQLQLERLESEKSIIELKNENLNKEIESRNRELAVSTMAMIKKNEALTEIKSELSKLKSTKDLKSVSRLLEKNMNSKEDWENFEQAFNHADKNFFKRLKDLHPSLTSGDLRLCVYLRLNLASKEIAPLLNISPRSVEIKRYRLRKKLELDTNQGLTDYLISL